MLLFLGKEEGEAARRHCNKSSFITLMLVYMLYFVSFFLSLFVFFSFPFKGKTLKWMEYLIMIYITLSVCVCIICLFNIHDLLKYYTSISAPVEGNCKGHCNRPTCHHSDNKHLKCYNEMVSCKIVLRKVKEKVAYF